MRTLARLPANSQRVVRYLVLALAVVACTRAEGHRKESREEPDNRSSTAVETLHMVVNGQPVAARSALATTRHGDTAYLVFSSVPDRTCDQVFGKGRDEVSDTSGDVLVWLDLVRAPSEVRDANVPANLSQWHVVNASWPAASSRGVGRDLQMPDDIGARGGELAVRLSIALSIRAEPPVFSLVLDGMTAVTPCGDRSPSVAPSQLEDHMRQFPLRGEME
jgi:hypothetical protein